MGSRRRWMIFGLGLVLSLVFLALALRDLHLGEVWTAMRAARYAWVVPGLLVYFISVYVRSWRWAYLLRAAKPLRAIRLFPIIIIGYMGNDIFPFRLGEVLRAYVLWRREGVNFGTTLTTAVAERLFDGLTMVLFVVLGLLFIPLSAMLRPLVMVAGAIFLTALLVFLVLAGRPALLRQIAQRLIAALIPQKLRAPLLGLVEGVITGLAVFRSGSEVLITFALTLLVWLLEVGKYWLVSQAFALHMSFPAIMLMGGTVNLLTALPSLPGYVGTFEMGIKVLQALGAGADVAGSYILVLHALLWFPIVALGLVFFLREGLSWSEVQQASQMQAAPNRDAE